jgi:hypothetical protein
MTDQVISRLLLQFHQAKQLLLWAIILNSLGMIYLFFTSSLLSFVVNMVAVVILIISYLNVKKGKAGGFYGGALVYVLNALGIFFVTISGDTSLLYGIFITLLFIVIFSMGIKAKKLIPESIDIVKSIKAFVEDTKQQKKAKTFRMKERRESIKNGTFEMELIYKETES